MGDTAFLEEMQRQWRKISNRGAPLLGKFHPRVSFVIPGSDLPLYQYQALIRELIEEFLKTADDRNKEWAEYVAIRAWDRPNEEGGLGSLYFDGVYISHCKMYLFDGEQKSSFANPEGNYEPWRGLLFRDHPDPNPEFQLGKVFLIANCFEGFLRTKGVEFTRFDSLVS